MSNSLVPMKKVAVEDPRINISQERTYAIPRGGAYVRMTALSATSVSSSSITWNVNPPSPEVIVGKKVYINITYLINFTGTTTGENLLDEWGYYMAPRFMPFNNSLQTVSLKLNDANFDLDVNRVLPALARIRWSQCRSDMFSTTPDQLDQSQSYVELIGQTRNPLGSYGSSDSTHGHNRGGFNGVRILTNTPTSASLELTITEPLVLSPLSYDAREEQGFYGIQNLSITAIVDQNLVARLLSDSPGNPATFSNITATIQGLPTALFTYITPPNLWKRPQYNVHPYSRVNSYLTDNNIALAPGASFQQTINNIQLSTIPRSIVIFIRENANTLTTRSTDTFARIQQVDITFDNKSGILGGSTPQQLFQMSKKNGLNMRWEEWYGSYGTSQPRAVSGVGGVLVIDPTMDLGLTNPDTESSGVNKTIQFQMTITYQNIDRLNAKTFTIFTLTSDDGMITIMNNRCIQQVGVVSEGDVLTTAELTPVITTNEAEALATDGGDFGTAFKSFFRNLPGYLQTAGKYVGPVMKGVEAILPLLAGLGAEQKQKVLKHYKKHGNINKYKAMLGNGVVGGCCDEMGSGVVGGKMLSRGKLQRLLM